MCPWYASAVSLLVCCQYVCATGDPVMYFPPFEVRTVKSERPYGISGNQYVQPDRIVRPMPQHPTMQQVTPEHVMLQQHQAPANRVNSNFQDSQPGLSSAVNLPEVNSAANVPDVNPKVDAVKSADNKTFTFAELLHALTDVEEKKEKHNISRAAGYDYPYSSYDYRPPYDYSQPSYGAYGYNPSRMYLPPTSVHYLSKPEPLKFDVPKKDVNSLMSPGASKIASKLSDLISFLLTLLTGESANSPQITGFKDLLVNGIVKPLLIAKGSLKVLLNKLTIPVISLLLINIEIFVTIWWLWEDCPKSSPPPPYYPPRPQYGYS